MPAADAMIDLGVPRRIHIVAIGGAGMSGIAVLLCGLGHFVSGSDRADGPFAAMLRSGGVPVAIGHDAARVHGADLVAASVAVPDSNVELVEARRLGIPVARRIDLLAAAVQSFDVVAVAGTHGKSSTTAMLAVILDRAGMNPSFLVGATVPQLGASARYGGTRLVIEADESDGSFLRLGARSAIVTNIEPDHLDYYGTYDALVDAFARFAGLAAGPVVLGADDSTTAALASDLGKATYGLSPASTVRLENWRSDGLGSRWQVDDRELGVSLALSLATPGLHMATNATGAAAMALRLGVEPSAVVEGVQGYRGAGRRFERRGSIAGVEFVDDYAHLPAELRANLIAVSARRDSAWQRVVAVFQPHLYTRTRDNAEAFGDVLGMADLVVLAPVYGAREEPIEGVDSGLIAAALGRTHPEIPVVVAPSRAELAHVVWELVRPGDLCISFGAGDITTLADEVRALAATT